MVAVLSPEYLGLAVRTISVWVAVWSLVSAVRDVPPPTMTLRVVVAIVGTAILLWGRAPVNVHVFWAIIHVLPFAATFAATATPRPVLDTLIILLYFLFVVNRGHPYNKLYSILAQS